MVSSPRRIRRSRCSLSLEWSSGRECSRNRLRCRMWPLVSIYCFVKLYLYDRMWLCPQRYRPIWGLLVGIPGLCSLLLSEDDRVCDWNWKFVTCHFICVVESHALKANEVLWKP
jgi:hypothetical protein